MGRGVKPNLIWITRSFIPTGRGSSLESPERHFLWAICSRGGIAGWNMEYEWVPPPIRASIRDHLRGSGPLLRGCRVWSGTVWSRKWWWGHTLEGIASLYHYDQCGSKIVTADNNCHWAITLDHRRIFSDRAAGLNILRAVVLYLICGPLHWRYTLAFSAIFHRPLTGSHFSWEGRLRSIWEVIKAIVSGGGRAGNCRDSQQAEVGWPVFDEGPLLLNNNKSLHRCIVVHSICC